MYQRIYRSSYTQQLYIRRSAAGRAGGGAAGAYRRRVGLQDSCAAWGHGLGAEGVCWGSVGGVRRHAAGVARDVALELLGWRAGAAQGGR